jgi:transposase
MSAIRRATGLSRQSVHNALRRYRRRRAVEDLADAPRSGRPRVAPAIGDEQILAAWRSDPLALGYDATGRTVDLLARHLSAFHAQSIRPRTLRRRMRALKLRWKRPRHMFHLADPLRGRKKRGIRRRLKAAIAYEPVLAADETILRLFPPLRQARGLVGGQARVRISGYDARRVLHGAINVKTGRRILHRGRSMRRGEFHVFLRTLRLRCRTGRRIWLLLDRHGSHDSAASRDPARSLDVVLLFLPRQCPELNPMDHLWREVKRNVSANRQFDGIDRHADAAEAWLLGLTATEARRKAGVLSKNFWLVT